MNEIMKKIEQTAVPTHLIEATTSEIKKAAEKTIKVEEPEKDDPRLQETYPFHFSWKDGRGKLWEGDFVNKILSIGEQQAVGVMRATLSGGIEFKAIDTFSSELNLMISHLSFSLTKKPKWAEDLRELKDYRLLQEIYGEVASHEATFFGY